MLGGSRRKLGGHSALAGGLGEGQEMAADRELQSGKAGEGLRGAGAGPSGHLSGCPTQIICDWF